MGIYAVDERDADAIWDLGLGICDPRGKPNSYGSGRIHPALPDLAFQIPVNLAEHLIPQ